MEIDIIGLPKSGKTTLFNALTHGKAETAAYATGDLEPNIGVVKVPDPRLEVLARIFKPKKVTHAEVRYIDLAGGGYTKGAGFSSQYTSYLTRADLLLHLVRAFTDPGVPHIEGSVDPARDIEAIDLELAFTDLALLEKRLQRIGDTLKGAKASERDAYLKEQALLERMRAQLEEGTLIREQSFTEDEAKALANYQFLTSKPMLIVLNLGEKQLPEAAALEEEYRSRFGRPDQGVAALCAKLEMELSQLGDAEAQEFRSDMGLAEPGLDRVIGISYALLGLISFLTGGPDEVRAWTIHQGTIAQKAAGKIHSDIERGFIRAEVVHFDDLMRMGSMAEAKKHGLVRLEGKTYVVRDGDVMNVLFNV